MATRVTSTRLIGRAAELAELEAALAEAADERPSIVFLAGESGVGKSRLLAELERRAVEGGALVLAGDCVDLGESELPYVPLVAALRPLARSGDPALTEPVRAAVAPLLPGLAPTSPEAEDGAQARLFEGLLSLLNALGEQRPVLLLIEDLHWADRSTRAALAFLARSLVAERVLLVCSYRPDELHRRHPLRPLLAEVERNARARRVTLEPLTREELAGQLADILGAPPEADLLERLWTRSGGNPLYSEELLAAGLDGRGAAPDTLRDALMLRVEHLSEPAQEILRLVAVGQRTDHPLLAGTSGLDERTLRDALREAVDSHILVADDDGRYRFRHALLREVVEDDLLPGERAALHLRAGARAGAADRRAGRRGADRRRRPPLRRRRRAARRARVVGPRGDGGRARLRARRGGRAARARARALGPRARRRAARRRGPRRAALARRPGGLGARPSRPAARALRDRARRARPRRRPAPRRRRCSRAIARAQRSLNRPKSSIETLERALELVEGADGKAGEARARLLAGLARGRMLDGRFVDSVETARQALDATIAAGLRWAEGHARNTLGFSLAMIGEIDEGAEQLRHAIRIARERDDLADLSDAYVNYSDMLHVLGRSDEARAITLEGRDVVGGRRPIATMWLDCQLSEFAYDVGDWEESEHRLPDPLRWTGVHTRVNLNLRKAHLLVGRGRHDAARDVMTELTELAADSSEPQFVGPVATLTAELRRREGDLDAARAAIDRGLDQMEFCTDDAARVVGRRRGRGHDRGRRRPARPRPRRQGGGDRRRPARRRPALARRRGRRPHAADRVRPAARRPRRGGPRRRAPRPGRVRPGGPGVVGRSRARSPRRSCAGARPRPTSPAGDREAATVAACAAEEIAVRLGAGWLRGEIEGLAARARLDIAAELDEEPADEPEEDDGFGLTSRERQVLALVAEGATNREIGAQLFMAEKTASVHVSRILSKLNVRSRTEAAAVAHRNRLSCHAPR